MSDKKVLKTVILPVILSVVIIVSIITYIFVGNSTSVNAQDLSKNVTANKVSAETLPDDFIAATSDFSISLFKKSISASENSLISPTSVALALGMTANGADGNTLTQFKKLLGGGTLTIDQLNKYYYTMSSNLQNDKTNKIHLANSIWYRQDASLKVNPNFLQANADFYKAAAYKADFNSQDTVKDINKWVKSNTNGLIDKIVDKIDADTIMYLFNTVLFEAEWKNAYKTANVRDGKFTLSDGSNVSTKFMHSFESYLKSDTAQGFIKPYKGDKFSFVAILPNESISLEDYIKSLDGKSFLNFVNSKSDDTASIGLPKFKYDYEVSLVKPLKDLGFTEGFDSSKANFSKMATSSDGNIYIGDLLHKTFIQVDELGTKAGAVTKVEMTETGMALETKKVILNRPFVYAIIDNETKLPLFIGTVMNPAK
ncbi:MAG TPA: serpin family protein [Ruminiclostridium sp.]